MVNVPIAHYNAVQVALTQALTSLAAAQQRVIEVERQLMDANLDNSVHADAFAAAQKELRQEQASSMKWAARQAVHLHQIGLRINDDVSKSHAWFNHRAELAESKLSEAQQTIENLKEAKR
jgi:hypothetical protein